MKRQCEGGLCKDNVEVLQCHRETDGNNCASPQYGAWSACRYGDICDENGSASRSVREVKCRAGGCVESSFTERKDCPRYTEGKMCDSVEECNYKRCITLTWTCRGGFCDTEAEPRVHWSGRHAPGGE
jgi:hypothetical protein